MGVCASKDQQSAEELLARKRAEEVDQQLMEDQFMELFNFKILLLGAGESGKSTIVKQLKLLHNSKPTESQLVDYGDALHANVLDSLQTIVDAAEEKLGLTLTAEEKKIVADMDAFADDDETSRIDHKLGEKLLTLWNGENVQAAYARRNEFWLLEATNYYMKNLVRFTELGFTPNEEDVVRARVRTTGIDVSPLEWRIPNAQEGEPNKLILKVVDVGGQRTERKKWLHCFSDVKCILFIVNLAGYHKMLFEDNKVNRMTESMKLLYDLSHKEEFMQTPFFIFLNKKDLFEEDLKTHPLSERFPDYKGDNSTMDALEFIKDQFRLQVPQNRRDAIKLFVVTGVVKAEIKGAFLEVKHDLMRLNRPKINQAKANLVKMGWTMSKTNG